jgi:hypothetical protein
MGRPAVRDGDVELLLALFAANPGSDCGAEFAEAVGRNLTKHRVRVRYREAAAAIAKMKE